MSAASGSAAMAGAAAGTRGLAGAGDIAAALAALTLERGEAVDGLRLRGRGLARAWLGGMRSGLVAWAANNALEEWR